MAVINALFACGWIMNAQVDAHFADKILIEMNTFREYGLLLQYGVE